MSVIVRVAEDCDLPYIVDMQEYHKEENTTYGELSFDKKLCTENMAVLLHHKTMLILVAYDTKKCIPVGYIWLVHYQPHYSTDFYYSEILTFVIPECRGSSVLYRLIDKAKLISRYAGAKYLQLGNFSGTTKTSQAYSKRYSTVGEVYNVNFKE